ADLHAGCIVTTRCITVAESNRTPFLIVGQDQSFAAESFQKRGELPTRVAREKDAPCTIVIRNNQVRRPWICDQDFMIEGGACKALQESASRSSIWPRALREPRMEC